MPNGDPEWHERANSVRSNKLIGLKALILEQISFGLPIAIANHVDALLTAAASGLRSRLESLDMLSNNMANSGTAGFKADRGAYATYFAPESLDGPAGSLTTVSPVVERRWTDHSQGTLMETGSPLDIALSGDGFFVVQHGQARVYTRNGSFALSPDGQITTKTGDKVLDTAGRHIKLDPEKPFTIEKDGAVRQGEQLVAKLAIANVRDANALGKRGNTYFSYSAEGVVQNSQARIYQGKLEASNFSPVESAIGVVQVMRQFEMLQRAITLGSELNRRAIEEVGKV